MLVKLGKKKQSKIPFKMQQNIKNNVKKHSKVKSNLYVQKKRTPR